MVSQTKKMIYHKPVLLNETIDALNLAPGKVIVDCTLGGGGHSEAILEKISSSHKSVANLKQMLSV